MAVVPWKLPPQPRRIERRQWVEGTHPLTVRPDIRGWQGVNVRKATDSRLTDVVTLMSAKAEKYSWAIGQVSERTSHSSDGFVGLANGSNWPHLAARNRREPIRNGPTRSAQPTVRRVFRSCRANLIRHYHAVESLARGAGGTLGGRDIVDCILADRGAAYRTFRRFEQIRAWSRTPEHGRRFAQERHAIGADDAESAVRGGESPEIAVGRMHATELTRASSALFAVPNLL